MPRKRKLFYGPLSVRKKPKSPKLSLVVLSTITVGLLLIFLKAFGLFSSFPLAPTLSRPRTRRWIPPAPRQPHPQHSISSLPFLPMFDTLAADESNFPQESAYSGGPQHDGITAILPVTLDSLNDLDANMDSLLSTHPSLLHEIIVACHPSLMSKTESAVRKARASREFYVMSVLPWDQVDKQPLGLLHILPSVFTRRVLLLDATALRDIDDATRMTLLDSVPSNVPIGPNGVLISPTNVSCIYARDRTVPAAYLLPPFLAPTLLLIQAENGMRLDAYTWASLGDRIAKTTSSAYGGLAMATSSQSRRWCIVTMSDHQNPTSTFLQAFYSLLQRNASAGSPAPLHFNILLPERQDLESFGSTACEMAQRGSILRIMLFSWFHTNVSPHFALDVGCHLHFETTANHSSTAALINGLKAWVLAGNESSILIYAPRTSKQTMEIETAIEGLQLARGVAVRIPVDDLPFSDWMATLSIPEWQNWYKPRIDLSIITNDRPHSLVRLLNSLTRARYYGDAVQLKINLEQTADTETRRTVAHFPWASGIIHVQHRIIAAGLLPAVMEAWYPHDNDSYGVLLEDDIEVSPMFYAWMKMAILRYRYGYPEDRAPSLFGVSLYQPTNLELRVEGRVPFDPRILFAEHGLPDYHTPYLSQIPCSWGAVYFPEHFQEFHDYLGLRLSEVSHNISEAIVPDIRSNRWKRSWKKYFNELVYLRGYVMLYPNYDLSLATNHVEIGAHVKSGSENALDTVKRQFDVPLMHLPSVSPTGKNSVGLLDLPSGSLPAWDALPVLDLWGNVTYHEELFQRGRERHGLVSGCPSLDDTTHYTFDANELLCPGVTP